MLFWSYVISVHPFCLLDDHITQLHGDGTHSCQGCYSVFLRPSLLRQHQQYCNHYKQYREEQKKAFIEGMSDSTKGIVSM